jgi:beta-galactosidase
MYTTEMPELKAGALLQINDLHDYAIVMIDGEVIGRLYRGSKYENTLRLKKDVRAGAELSIFVEAMGRINYSKLINDPKGITNSVCAITTDGKNDVTYNLKDWKVNLFPVTGTPYEDKSYIPIPEGEKSPAYFRASFKLKTVGDTYLDMSTWGKGLVWINGHCIGRFWEVGPQQTLYVPGCWLKKGANDIVVLDIAGPRKASVKGVSKPIVDELHREFLPKDGFVTKGASVSAVDTKSFVGNDAAPGAK